MLLRLLQRQRRQLGRGKAPVLLPCMCYCWEEGYGLRVRLVHIGVRAHPGLGPSWRHGWVARGGVLRAAVK